MEYITQRVLEKARDEVEERRESNPDQFIESHICNVTDEVSNELFMKLLREFPTAEEES